MINISNNCYSLFQVSKTKNFQKKESIGSLNNVNNKSVCINIPRSCYLTKINFTGKKHNYDWHDKENWWPQIEQALNSKAADRPLLLKPEKMPIIMPNKSWQGIATYNPGAFYEQLPGEKEPKFHVLFRASDNDYPHLPTVSRFGLIASKDGMNLDQRPEKPLQVPMSGDNVWGIEDPRITKIGDNYHILYCAYSPGKARLAMMITKNFKNECEITKEDVEKLKQDKSINQDQVKKLEKFVCKEGKKYEHSFYLEEDLEKQGLSDLRIKIFNTISSGIHNIGLIGPDMEDKDVVLFPKKIKDPEDGKEKFAMMHRLGDDIQIAYFDKPEDLNEQYWDKYLQKYDEDKSNYTLMEAKFGWEEKLGAGPPPIETDDGYLFIYHTSKIDEKTNIRMYIAGAVILDKENPKKIKHRVPHPIIAPRNKYEKGLSICKDAEGNINKYVVFPTGIAEKGDDLFIYSGAGDKFTEVYKTDKQDLVDYIKKFDAEGNLIDKTDHAD